MIDSPSDRISLRLMPRRDVLKATVLGTAGAVATLTIDPAQAIAAGVPAERVRAWIEQAENATPEAMAAYEPQALTADEFATVRAAVGRLIPTDDLGPGADEAGVHIYIDRILAGRAADALPIYQEGLAALNEAAGDEGFAAADTGVQDEVLKYFEGGGTLEATPAASSADVTGIRLRAVEVPETFFATLLEHTRQGMFGDPIHGGNANFAGWDLIGYPGIKLVWTENDQAIDATVEPEHTSVAQYGKDA